MKIKVDNMTSCHFSSPASSCKSEYHKTMPPTMINLFLAIQLTTSVIQINSFFFFLFEVVKGSYDMLS